MECKRTHELAELCNQTGGITIKSDDIKKLKEELKINCHLLFEKKSLWNRNYQYIKNKLYKLNKELDIFDNSIKNKLDQEKYIKLSDVEQCLFLIDDIFDNYRTSMEVQVYTQEQKKKILDLFELISKFVKSNFFKELWIVVRYL